MSDSQQIERKVREIVAEQLGIGEEDVLRDSKISGDLGADTLDMVELMMALEEEFQVELPEESVAHLETIGDLIDHLSRRANS